MVAEGGETDAGGDAAPKVPGLDDLCLIGQGAFSVVYRALHQGRPVAVKLQRELHPSSEARRRVWQEAAALARLDHPGLCRVLSVGELDERIYIVMELVEGRSLAEHVAKAPVSEVEARAVGAGIADALVEVHRLGLVHGDVKPRNVLLDAQGAPKLIDFGLVRGARTEEDPADSAFGTILYSAPEQFGLLKRPVDARSDLYSLGVVLFELVAGESPFRASDAGELLRLHAAVVPPSLRERKPEVSQHFAGIVARLLAKDPDDRFQSARELARALRTTSTVDQAAASVSSAASLPVWTAAAESLAGAAGELPWAGPREPLDRVMDLWREVRRGGGRAALIVGESGSGKSRALRELGRRFAAESVPWVGVRSASTEAVPFAFLRQVLDEALRWLERGGAADSLATEHVLQAVGYGAPYLRAISPVFARLYPEPVSKQGLATVRFDAQGEGHVIDAVVDALKALALELDGLVLMVDDAQHLDEPSLRWLERLDRRLLGTPLLVVATVLGRGQGPGKAPASPPGDVAVDAAGRVAARLSDGLAQGRRLELPELDAAAARHLVAAFLRSDAFEPVLVERLLARSGGNPLALTESLHALVDEGLLRFTWGRWSLASAGLERLRLPTRLLDIIVERLKLLGPEGARVLSAAALLGPRFDRERLRALEPSRAASLEDVLSLAVATRVLEPAGGRAYAFVHERAREALLEVLTEAERSALHRRAFEVLSRADAAEPDGARGALAFTLAHHAYQGRSELDVSVAFRACAEAATLALARCAHREAQDWFARAREVAERDPRFAPPARFFLEAGLAAEAVGHREDAERLYRRAVATAEEPTVKGRAYIELGKLLTVKSEESAKSLADALRTFGERYPSSRVGAFLWTVASWAWGFVWPARVVADERERERLRLVFAALLHAGYAEFYNQRPLGMLQAPMLERRIARRIGASDELATWFAGASAVVAAVGLRGLSRRLGERGLAMAEQLGNPGVIGAVLVHRGHGLEMGGDPLGAERSFRRSLDEYRRWLAAAERIGAAATLASNLHMRGYARQAMEVVESLTQLDPDARAGQTATEFFHEIDTIDNLMVRVARLLLGLPVRPLAERVYDWRGNQRSLGPWMTALIQGYLMLDRLYAGAPYERVDELLEGFLAQRSELSTNHQLHQLTIAESWIRLDLLERAVAELAPEEERRRRAEALRGAHARLRRGAHHPSVRAHALVIDARRLWGAGRSGASRRRAQEAEEVAQRFDNPWVLFELARLRATMFLDEGLPHAAQREARRALDLALQHGWSDRARRVTSEFHLASQASRSSLTQSSGGSSTKSQSIAGADAVHASRSLAALLQVSLASTTVLDPERQSRLVLDELVRVMGAERALLFLAPVETASADGATAKAQDALQLPRVSFYAGRDLEGRDVPEGAGYSVSVVNEVLRTRAPVLVGGAGAGELKATESVLLHKLRSVMAVPLLIRDRVLGVAYVDNRLARGIFTAGDGAVFGAIAAHLAVAIETARSASLEAQVKAERARRQLSERFASLAASLSGSLELGEVLDLVLGHLTQLVPYRRAVVVLTDDTGASLAAQSGFDAPQLEERRVESTEGAAAWRDTLSTLAPAGVALLQEPLPPPFEARRRLDGDVLGVPLVVRGRVLGGMVLEVQRPTGEDASRLQLIRAFAGHAAIAVENARLFEAVRAQAVHDALTGLFTRRHLFALLEHEASLATRRERGFAVVMLDVDHFKRVNDVHGHGVGDEVLVAVAARLRGRARESDVIGRYGGEEFVVCLPDTDLAGAQHAAEALRAVIAASPIPTAGGSLPVTASFGVAASEQLLGGVAGARPPADRQGVASADARVSSGARPASSTSPWHAADLVKGLLQEADRALYRAKAEGRNRVVVAQLTSHDVSSPQVEPRS